jgi:hypothetical protein
VREEEPQGRDMLFIIGAVTFANNRIDDYAKRSSA